MSYITQTIDKSLPQEVIQLCGNLSWIIGDVDGMIVASSVPLTVYGMNIIPTGGLILQDISTISFPAATEGSTDDVYTPPVISGNLPPDEPISQVCAKSVTMYQLLKSKDSALVLPSTLQYGVTSPLLLYSQSLPIRYRGLCNALLIECMSVYKELLQATMQTGMASVTKSDVARMCNNLRWLSSSIEVLGTPQYDLLMVIRDMQRTLLYTQGLDYLFQTTYNTQTDDYNGAIGGAYNV